MKNQFLKLSYAIFFILAAFLNSLSAFPCSNAISDLPSSIATKRPITLWLRSETFEEYSPDPRTPLTPTQAKELVERGFTMVVEKSPHRVYPDHEYQNAGCTLIESGSWRSADENAFVIGLKYLPLQEPFEDGYDLSQNHIYFAHAWSGGEYQARTISRLSERKAEKPFFDLEDLVDADGNRIAAFGYYAGYAGSLLSVRTWAMKKLGIPPPYQAPAHSLGKLQILQEVESLLDQIKIRPRVVVIGANGRAGRGATDYLTSLGIQFSKWTRTETNRGHPFPELLDFDILINVASFSQSNPILVDHTDLLNNHNLSVIGDVSTYPGPYNTIPLYDDETSFKDLSIRVESSTGPVDIIAIDNLPALFPKESSDEYSEKLFPHLLEFLESQKRNDELPSVWKNAADRSTAILGRAQEIKQLGQSISMSCFSADGLFIPEKANQRLKEWLKGKELSDIEKEAFAQLIADGSVQTKYLRSSDVLNPKIKEQLESLKSWAERVFR